MIDSLIRVQYCYDLLISQIPVSLVLYSHIPTAVAALVFGLFVLFKARNLAGTCLFMVCLFFAAWCAFDLSTWLAFLGSSDVMFAWSLLDLVAVIMFFCTYYFLHVSITGKDLSPLEKAFGMIMVLPTAVWTFLGSHLTAFDANTCEALEHSWITLYPYVVEAAFIVAVLVLLFTSYRRATSRDQKRQVVLYGIGGLIFLTFFFSATLFVTILTTSIAGVLDPYNYEIYGLFGMPVLLFYLGYLIVRYKAFNLKVLGAQALVAALLLLIAAQFLFITSTASFILAGVTLIITLAMGYRLIQSVRQEVEQRERLEVLTAQLKEANDKLTSLSHFKTQLLSLASHQLKSPLAAIKGFASLLMDGLYGQLPEAAKETLHKIHHSADDLVNLINTLLDLRKVEEGKMDYQFAKADFSELVTGIFEQLQPLAAEKKISFTRVGETRPLFVNADAQKLKQVVLNLSDNAIKYTPEGHVTLSTDVAGNTLRFSVTDSGLGVAPDLLPHLFEEFTRDERVKTKIRGTGLGLYIASKIIEAHGGTISASSPGEGHGSTFTMTLPLA